MINMAMPNDEIDAMLNGAKNGSVYTWICAGFDLFALASAPNYHRSRRDPQMLVPPLPMAHSMNVEPEWNRLAGSWCLTTLRTVFVFVDGEA